MDESELADVLNETLHRLPLLCRVVEDGYSWLVGTLMVSKLELEPPSESSPRKVVHDLLRNPSFL